jgi:hypothetical protein
MIVHLELSLWSNKPLRAEVLRISPMSWVHVNASQVNNNRTSLFAKWRNKTKYLENHVVA